MTAVLRTSISLDGKVLSVSGKPLQGPFPASRLMAAGEMELTILPRIVGAAEKSTLSGVSGSFLPDESRWELLSTEQGSGGALVARYRRKGVSARRV